MSFLNKIGKKSDPVRIGAPEIADALGISPTPENQDVYRKHGDAIYMAASNLFAVILFRRAAKNPESGTMRKLVDEAEKRLERELSSYYAQVGQGATVDMQAKLSQISAKLEAYAGQVSLEPEKEKSR